MSGPFHLGLFMLLSTLCVLALYRKNKAILFFALVLFPTCLVMSLTRTTMIGLVLGTLILLVLLARFSLRSIAAVSIVVLLATVACVAFLPALPDFYLISTFLSTLTNLSETSSYQYRVGGWESDLLPAVISNPFGYGTGMAKDGAGFFTSHNMYFKVLLENGVVACALFLLSLLGVVWKCISNHLKLADAFLKQYNSFVLSFIFAMCVIGVSGPFLDAYPINIYFWFFSGSIFALRRLDAQEA